MNILIACEESQRVCTAFRERGFIAYTCDIEPCSGGHPEWHIKGDVRSILDGYCTFRTMDGFSHELETAWDLIIAHPPCTYLTVTGNRWYDANRYGEKAIQRAKDKVDAMAFFMRMIHAKCEHIAVENPIGIMSTAYRKPDQIYQPYYFGEPMEKRTCLWLKNLPKLEPTNEVEPPPRTYYDSGKSMPKWYADCWGLPKAERSRIRSITPKGVADAMATQWGDYLRKENESK